MAIRTSESPFQWQTSLWSLGESDPYSTKNLFNFLHVTVSAQNKRQNTEETIGPGPQQRAGINCTGS